MHYIKIYRRVNITLIFYNLLYTNITYFVIHLMAQVFTRNNNDSIKIIIIYILVLDYVHKIYMTALYCELYNNCLLYTSRCV